MSKEGAMNVNTEAADVLESAAELIARDGWGQGPHRLWGNYCLGDAIRLKASSVDECYAACDAVTAVASEDPSICARWMQFCTEGNFPTHQGIPVMFVNDYCLTSGEDAILLAKEAARRLSTEERQWGT